MHLPGEIKDRQVKITKHASTPVDTGRKLSVHKTFRRHQGRLLNVLCTFNLRPVATGTGINYVILTKRVKVIK